MGRDRTPISAGELERRLVAVRSEMAGAGIDVLVAYSQTEMLGGYVKYFIDVPAYGAYPEWLIVPADGGMTRVTHGALDSESRWDSDGSDVPLGVTRTLTTAAFISVNYTAEYETALVTKALSGHRSATIGLLGPHQIPATSVEHLHRELPQATFVDASDVLDRIKADKSPEELDLIRRTARMQDAAMHAVAAAIRPGMRDHEVAGVAQTAGEGLGSEYGLYMCGSAPIGEPAFTRSAHQQGRVIEAGDVVAVLIENAGPGGFFTELGRMFVLGTTPSSMVEGFEQMLAAQRHCVESIHPGSKPADIWHEHNEYLLERELPSEDRIHCHGQGYDLVERPLVRFDETLAISASTSLTCHPSMVRDGQYHWLCDNFLFDDHGRLERIHQFPVEIVEL